MDPVETMLGKAARKAAVPPTGPVCTAGSCRNSVARGNQQQGPAASFGWWLWRLVPVQGQSQQICRSAPSGAEPLVNLLSLLACALCKLSDACGAFGKLNNTSVLFSEAIVLSLSLVLQLDRDLNQCGTMCLCSFLWVMHLAVGSGMTYVLNSTFYATGKI